MPEVDENGNPIEEGGEGHEGEEEPKFKVDAEEYTQEQVREALKDSQNKQSWQQSNTQEAERIAGERGELERLQQIETSLQENPELWDGVQKLFNDHKIKKTGVSENGEDKERIAEKEESNQRMQAIEENMAYQDLVRNISDLKTRFPKAFEENEELDKKVVKYAQDNNINDIETAFRALMFDNHGASKLEEGQKLDQLAKERSKNLGIPAGGKTETKPYSVKGKSWDDIEKDIEANMGNSE